MRRALSVFVAVVSIPAGAWAQGGMPLGPEFRVNTFTTGAQGESSVAFDSSGNFVVVWAGDAQDGSYYGIFGQRYASSGTPLGPEFRVNTFLSSNQTYPSVAADSVGNFVVTWQSFGQDGSAYGVFGQRYATSGAPVGPEFRVNTYISGDQRRPAVASDPVGNFVVVWTSIGQDGSIHGIFGQRYASSGSPLGPEFRVNTYTTSAQYLPSVAASSTGDFVVVWQSLDQDGSDWGVFGQRYASTGAPSGPEFRVNTYTTNIQGDQSVAIDAAGNFVVAWSSTLQDGSQDGVFGQRYASSGAPVGAEFRVNTFTTNGQSYPAVAADSLGDFVVVWGSNTQDGSTPGIFGQRYASAGVPLGQEFRVNSYTTGDQDNPFVAADPAGYFVVVWTSATQDGSNDGVFGQRYGQIVPVELMHFGVE
jgi:hypothetical protein